MWCIHSMALEGVSCRGAGCVGAASSVMKPFNRHGNTPEGLVLVPHLPRHMPAAVVNLVDWSAETPRQCDTEFLDSLIASDGIQASLSQTV
jgi:hypothetical protein